MTRPIPRLPVTTVGSWPRSPALLHAQRRWRRSGGDARELAEVEDAAVREVVRAQERAGVDIVTDGEQRRDNFYSFIADRLDGVRMMTLAELFDVVEDKAAFEQLLRTLDVPASAISSPTCVGRLRRRRPLVADDADFLLRTTDRAVKVTLPGPYLLSRAMWLEPLSRAAYGSKEDLASDVVAILRDELDELRQLGVDVIQLDEPVLTEVVFTSGRTRTFMCASLAAKSDPSEELAFARELITDVLGAADGLRTAVHVCRGNWSRDDRTLLSGSYAPLAPLLGSLPARQLVLEFATPRAGELEALYGTTRPRAPELGLGVVDPRTEVVETPEEIAARARKALHYVAADALFLNPDCGFASFSGRPVNGPSVAERKLAAMAAAAASLRSSHTLVA